VSKYKFKKFERNQEPPKFRIGQTDIKILNDLSDCRTLDTKHILALHPEMSQRTLQSRLYFLFHAGYVERPVSQISYFRESGHLVYSLTKKGAGLVSQNKGLPSPAKKPKELGVSFLQHSLMISNFKTILNLALEKERNAKLIVWRELGPIDAVQCEGERLPIAPDAFFTLETKDYLMHFFLEVDRSTMTGERLLDKFKGYWIWRAEGRQKTKLEIANFRVLTICLSRERAENLRQIAKKADDHQTGSEMFWFACEGSYSLKEPENVLQNIWKTPKNDLPHCLLE
jgi:DNA-binding HxlR family transcriptional regulator